MQGLKVFMRINMKGIYECTYRLRTSDFNCHGRLQPASVLDLFQDVAGSHARELGIALGPDSDTGLIWVLAKSKYEELYTDKQFRTVVVRTWPHPPKGINYRRDYLISAEDGTPLVMGTSEWVVVSAEKRKIVMINDIYPLKDGEFCTDITFEGKLPRLNIASIDSEAYTVLPGFTDIDENNHVNNTKYANFVLNAVAPKPDEVISSFRLDYHKEVTVGNAISIFSKRENGYIYALGKSQSGENMFTCEIKLK